MRNLLGATIILALLAGQSAAQQRLDLGGVSSLDHTFQQAVPPGFAGAAPPNYGPQGYSTPAPPTPTPTPYSGRWVYYISATAIGLFPPVNVRYPASKACIEGECDPGVGASLPDSCTVDRPFLGDSVWLAGTCTTTAISPWPFMPNYNP